MLSLVIILIILEIIIFLILVARFFNNYFKYRYIGSFTIYLISSYILCLLFSLITNIYPPEGLINNNEFVLAIMVSFFDAIKMMLSNFSTDVITSYINSNIIWMNVFGIAYIITSFIALVATSISVILIFIKTLKPKANNFIRKNINKKNNVFIYTETDVKISLKLAKHLRDNGYVVKIILSRDSQDSGSGQEFKKQLTMAGFEVLTENSSSNFASFIIKNNWKINNEKETIIYGLFSDDEKNVSFANQFKKAICNSKIYYLTEVNKIALDDELYNKIKNEYNEIKDYKMAKQRGKLIKDVDAVRNNIYNNKKYLNIEDKNEINKLQEEEKIRIKEEDYMRINRLKVFVSYQDFDCNCIYKYNLETKGIINSISEYDIVSTNFIMDNPISNFIDINKIIKEKEINLGNMNVNFLGFGNVNQAIFNKMLQAYQLFSDNEYRINYTISAFNAKEMVEAYRSIYSNYEKKFDTDNYLKVPHLYDLNVAFDNIDLNNIHFIELYIKKMVEDNKHFAKNGFEMFVVACKKSNMNARISYYLRQAILSLVPVEKRDKTIVFTRMSNSETIDIFNNNDFVFRQNEFLKGFNSKKYLELNCPSCPIVIMGEDAFISDYVNNHYNKAIELSLKMDAYHLMNTLNIKPDSFELRKFIAKQKIKWQNTPKEQIMVNVSPFYQLRAKLNALGLDLNRDYKVVNKDNNIISKEQFDKILKEIFNENNIDEFGLKRTDNIIGERLLEMEHNRWIMAAYLTYRYLPYEIDKFNHSPLNTKNKDLRAHICMTTNKGLKDLEKLVFNNPKMTKEDKEEIKRVVYSYDLDFLNNLFAILNIEG